MGDDTVTHTGNQTITTVGGIVNSHTGDIKNFDLGVSYTNAGSYSSIFAGAYMDVKVALATENYVGGKLETLSGLLIENNPGELGKKQMSIEDVKTVSKKSAQVAILTSSLIMWG